MKFNTQKDFFNVGELHNICTVLRLSTDGRKQQLIERISNHVSKKISDDVDNYAESPTYTTTATQTKEELPIEPNDIPENRTSDRNNFNTILKWIFAALCIVIVVVLFFFLFKEVLNEKPIEVVVKRSWF